MAWKNEAKAAAEAETSTDAPAIAEPAAAAEVPAAEPFVEPAAASPQRTAAQIEWMQKHPDYVPMAHGGSVRFLNRGTLLADGVFVPEAQHPPMDGGGAMSVGVPVSARRR